MDEKREEAILVWNGRAELNKELLELIVIRMEETWLDGYMNGG